MRRIDWCIDSLKELPILSIIDDGSSDRTKQIAFDKDVEIISMI